MGKHRNTGSFILSLLINLLLNWELFIPAVILLILHFSVGTDIIWFWAVVGGAVLIELIKTALLTLAVNVKDDNKKQEVKYRLREGETFNGKTGREDEE